MRGLSNLNMIIKSFDTLQTIKELETLQFEGKRIRIQTFFRFVSLRYKYQTQVQKSSLKKKKFWSPKLKPWYFKNYVFQSCNISFSHKDITIHTLPLQLQHKC